MSLFSIASEKSRQRGYEYFTENKVISAKSTVPQALLDTFGAVGRRNIMSPLTLSTPGNPPVTVRLPPEDRVFAST